MAFARQDAMRKRLKLTYEDVAPWNPRLIYAAILNQIGANAPQSAKFALEAVNKGLETSLAEGLPLRLDF
jgi:hypothetical protein